MQQVVFKFGGIYLDTDTISVRPLHHHLRNSFVAFSLQWHNIQNAIFGFPQVQKGEWPQMYLITNISSRARIFSNLSLKLRGFIFPLLTLKSFPCHRSLVQLFSPPCLWVEHAMQEKWSLSQVQFGDPRVMMISQDFLTKNRTKSNLLIQVFPTNEHCPDFQQSFSLVWLLSFLNLTFSDQRLQLVWLGERNNNKKR